MKLPKAQVRELSPQQEKGFSVTLSDMCPLVSGITSKDAALSLKLGTQALDLAVGGAALAHPNNEIQMVESNDAAIASSDDNGVLRRGGHLVIKLLESEDVQEFSQICKPLFIKASLLKPKATYQTIIKRDLFDMSRSAVTGKDVESRMYPELRSGNSKH